MGFDKLIDGMYADEYTNPGIQNYISSEYKKQHTIVKSPLTHPLEFDPINPPAGWRYDPYYEVWVQQ